MAEVLAELVARITADATQLKKALAEAEKDVEGLGKETEKQTKSIGERFKDIGKAATIMGAAVTASFGVMMLSFDRTGSELHDLSLKTGMSTEALSGLKYAAEQNGASLGTVEMAIRRTAAAMQGVQDGTAESTRAFSRMGISLEELQGLNPEQQFLKIAGAIAEIPDPMTRAATAQDLFGRSGMDMLPMLSAGADGLRAMMQEGQRLSGWTLENTKLADDFGDALMSLKTSMSGATNAMASALAPALKGLTDLLTGISVKVADFIREQPELARAIGGATLAFAGLATAIGLVIMALSYLAAHPLVAPFTVALLVISGLVAAGIALADALGLIGKEADKAVDPTKKLSDALESTRKAAAKLATEAELATKQAIGAVDKLGAATIEALKRRNREQEQVEQDSLDTRIQAFEDFYDDQEREAGKAHRSIIDNIEEQRDAQLKAIDKERDALRKWYDDAVQIYEDARDVRLETLRDTTNTAIKGIESQIDAINAQKDTERQAAQASQDNARKVTLGEEWRIAKSQNDAEKMARIAGQLADLDSDIRKRAIEASRQVEIDKLRAKIEAIREDEKLKEKQYANDFERQKRALKTQYDTETTNNQTKLETAKTYWKEQGDIETAAYTEANLKRENEKTAEAAYWVDRKKSLTAGYVELNKEENVQAEARKILVAEDQKELITLLETYNPLWQEAGRSFGEQLLNGLESMRTSIQAKVSEILALVGIAHAATASASIASTQIVNIQTGVRSGGTSTAPGAGGWIGPEYAQGGIVSGGLGEPQLAMVHGGETISPPGQSGLSIIFQGPVYGFSDFESKVAQAVKEHAIRGGFHGVLKGA